MAELSDSTELPPGEPLTPVEPKPIQFRLQHLFVAMIWIGITLGLSQFEFGDSGFRATGLHRVFGSLLLSFGLAIIWLNAFGWFESSQTRNWTILWTGFGAMLFVVSLVLPAIAVFGYTMGWEVALDTLEVFYAETEPLESRFYYGCMAVSNVLILLSPLVAWHRD